MASFGAPGTLGEDMAIEASPEISNAEVVREACTATLEADIPTATV